MPSHRQGCSTHREAGIGDPRGRLPKPTGRVARCLRCAASRRIGCLSGCTWEAVVWAPYVRFYPPDSLIIQPVGGSAPIIPPRASCPLRGRGNIRCVRPPFLATLAKTAHDISDRRRRIHRFKSGRRTGREWRRSDCRMRPHGRRRWRAQHCQAAARGVCRAGGAVPVSASTSRRDAGDLPFGRHVIDDGNRCRLVRAQQLPSEPGFVALVRRRGCAFHLCLFGGDLWRWRDGLRR